MTKQSMKNKKPDYKVHDIHMRRGGSLLLDDVGVKIALSDDGKTLVVHAEDIDVAAHSSKTMSVKGGGKVRALNTQPITSNPSEAKKIELDNSLNFDGYKPLKQSDNLAADALHANKGVRFNIYLGSRQETPFAKINLAVRLNDDGKCDYKLSVSSLLDLNVSSENGRVDIRPGAQKVMLHSPLNQLIRTGVNEDHHRKLKEIFKPGMVLGKDLALSEEFNHLSGCTVLGLDPVWGAPELLIPSATVSEYNREALPDAIILGTDYNADQVEDILYAMNDWKFGRVGVRLASEGQMVQMRDMLSKQRHSELWSLSKAMELRFHTPGQSNIYFAQGSEAGPDVIQTKAYKIFKERSGGSGAKFKMRADKVTNNSRGMPKFTTISYELRAAALNGDFDAADNDNNSNSPAPSAEVNSSSVAPLALQRD